MRFAGMARSYRGEGLGHDEGALFTVELFAQHAIAQASVEALSSDGGGDQQGLYAALQSGFLDSAHKGLADAFALLRRGL